MIYDRRELLARLDSPSGGTPWTPPAVDDVAPASTTWIIVEHRCPCTLRPAPSTQSRPYSARLIDDLAVRLGWIAAISLGVLTGGLLLLRAARILELL